MHGTWISRQETQKSEIMIITNVTVKIPASCQYMKLNLTSCWKSLNLFFGISTPQFVEKTDQNIFTSPPLVSSRSHPVADQLPLNFLARLQWPLAWFQQPPPP